MASKNAIDVAVDNGSRQSEGKAADSSSGVVANAFEGEEAFDVGGETTERSHLFGSSVQVAGAAVVA